VKTNEQMHRLRLFTDPDPALAVIDLGLLAGRGLEPDGRQLRPPALGAKRLEMTLHLLVGPGETEGNQFAVHNHFVPPDLHHSALDKIGKPVERTRQLPELSAVARPRI